MRNLRLVLSAFVIATAAHGAEINRVRATPRLTAAASSSPRIPFKELPPAVQSQIEQIEFECRVPPQFISRATARALEINSDFRTDFLYSPGDGNKSWPNGFGGLCGAADGSRLVLMISNDKGGYDQIVVGSYVAVLQSADDVIFTDWCGGSHADPSVSLAVLDNDQKRLVQFGRCFPSIDAALTSARRKGYHLVRW